MQIAALEISFRITIMISSACAQADTHTHMLEKHAYDPPAFLEAQHFSDERASCSALWP